MKLVTETRDKKLKLMVKLDRDKMLDKLNQDEVVRARRSVSTEKREKSTDSAPEADLRKKSAESTEMRLRSLVLGRPCLFGCDSDSSSKGRSLTHYRLTHQVLRCKFRCPGEKGGERCTRPLAADLNDSDCKHLRKCFPEYGYPRKDFWEMG
eukprot:GHVU01013930.1.p1 GENE.GHVU01013930.1~~GHVU01013930.1.p1  ORF type:complete len:152 (-),score=13.72 GHVU01013930.1:303-758(-)